MFNRKKTVAKESNSNNIIQNNTTIKGNIETKGSLRIDGTVIGDIISTNKVVLGATGKIEGNITSKNLDIAGKIYGTLNVQEVLVMKSTALVQGDLTIGHLITESGSVFNGTCTMTSQKENIGKKTG